MDTTQVTQDLEATFTAWLEATFTAWKDALNSGKLDVFWEAFDDNRPLCRPPCTRGCEPE
jgi:hypothetical protein